MRGIHTLKKIGNVINPQPSLFADKAEISLYEEKVKLIIARYYFFSTQHIKTDTILLKLQAEFFISTERLADIIAERVPDIQALRASAPKREWFKTNWAHLLW